MKVVDFYDEVALRGEAVVFVEMAAYERPDGTLAWAGQTYVKDGEGGKRRYDAAIAAHHAGIARAWGYSFPHTVVRRNRVRRSRP